MAKPIDVEQDMCECAIVHAVAEGRKQEKKKRREETY
jgi:hypothetical protein